MCLTVLQGLDNCIAFYRDEQSWSCFFGEGGDERVTSSLIKLICSRIHTVVHAYTVQLAQLCA